MKSTQPIGNRQSAVINGFTLIEIMLVVVIMLIVAGVAVPMFSGTSGATQMTDAVRSTIRTARYARSMAILNQADCTLTFTTNRISLTGSEGAMVDKRISDKIQMTEFENLTDDESDDGGSNTVLFYSSGMNDGFELTLSDDKNRSHTITCNPITGKVTVDDD